MRPKSRNVKKIRTPKVSPIAADKFIDYKDIGLLSKFVTERGKIVPRVKTGVSSKQQQALAKAIKHARHLALLPFTVRV